MPFLAQVAAGRRESLRIWGDDYPTPDGTGIRDYIHVTDLAAAHVLALRRLEAGGASTAYNLGNGEGLSVRQVIDAVARVTGRPVPHAIGPRRPGDPARLVAMRWRMQPEVYGCRLQQPEIRRVFPGHASGERGRGHGVVDGGRGALGPDQLACHDTAGPGDGGAHRRDESRVLGRIMVDHHPLSGCEGE